MKQLDSVKFVKNHWTLVHRSLGTSTGGLFRPTGKGRGEGTTIGGGGERIGSPKNFT